MRSTRRAFISRFVGAMGVIGTMAAFPTQARACLYGKWHVMCANRHVNSVDDGTCQHKCEQCGLQVFNGNVVTVVCRNGHPNTISTGAGDKQHVTQHYMCPTCNTDCRLG
jgi:hypothetical protein